MNNVKIETNYIDLAEECEDIMADLEEIKRKLRTFRSKFTYDSNIVTILDSYVIPYVEGLLGGGQIMMSLEDIFSQLDESAKDTYIEIELDPYCIPDEEVELCLN